MAEFRSDAEVLQRAADKLFAVAVSNSMMRARTLVELGSAYARSAMDPLKGPEMEGWIAGHLLALALRLVDDGADAADVRALVHFGMRLGEEAVEVRHG